MRKVAGRQGRVDPRAAVFIEETALNSGFAPRKQPIGGEGRAGIEEEILAIELDNDDTAVQFVAVHPLGDEEVIRATGDQRRMSVQTSGAGETQKEPGDLRAKPVAELPNFFGIIRKFHLIALELLGRDGRFISEVAELLAPIIDLLKLYIRGIRRRYDGSDGLGHRFALIREGFCLAIFLLAKFSPIFVFV